MTVPPIIIIMLAAAVVALAAYQWLVRHQHAALLAAQPANQSFAATVRWSIHRESALRSSVRVCEADVVATTNQLVCFPFERFGIWRWYYHVVVAYHPSDAQEGIALSDNYRIDEVRYGATTLEIINNEGSELLEVTTKIICSSTDPQIVQQIASMIAD